ncbi:MAG: recombinase family protein [Clostridiales bacterium]|nr:recombinase family protein [Clostridiales bacterium]
MFDDIGKRRIVIYARVSTEHKEQLDALENQLDWYKPILALKPEWELVNRYIDKGITGTSAEKRPQFMQMIRDAKERKFDMIITREVSRFARNTVDTLQYTRMLKEYGVEVFFINDNIRTCDCDGELRLTIMATLAQDESRKTSVRVKSGLQTSMNNGVFFGNGNILGYDRIETRIGNEKNVEFRQNPEQSKTVRMIYDMYLRGDGLTKIKYQLEQAGRLTATGKTKWFETVISNVLKNSFYCGIITYHKEFTPDYLKQKKIKNYGEVEFTQVQGRHEPIVTVEEYERVQRIMASKKQELKNVKTGRQTPATKGKLPRKDIWSKLLVCSCGHTFSKRVWTRKNGVSNPAYLCYGQIRTGSYQTRKNKGLSLEGICDTPMIPGWKLQMMANIIFRDFLNNKQHVLEIANSLLRAHVPDDDNEQDRERLLEDKKAELMRLQHKRENLVDMRADDLISKEEFQKRVTPIDNEIGLAYNAVKELECQQHPETEVVNYEEKLTVLQYALERYTDFDKQDDVPPEVIEAFVEKIVASKDGFEWYLRFDGDPNDPLKCSFDGKRREKATLSIAGKIFPTQDISDAGGD